MYVYVFFSFSPNITMNFKLELYTWPRELLKELVSLFLGAKW